MSDCKFFQQISLASDEQIKKWIFMWIAGDETEPVIQHIIQGPKQYCAACNQLLEEKEKDLKERGVISQKAIEAAEDEADRRDQQGTEDLINLALKSGG